MEKQHTLDKDALFRPVRLVVAATITLGAVMHIMGAGFSLAFNQAMPWWCWAVFGVAGFGYPASAVLILKNKMPGYVFALAGPLIGGTLIFLGFVFPESRLLMLIPGTYFNEITPIGYLTLIVEPVAVAGAGLCLWQRVWDRG